MQRVLIAVFLSACCSLPAVATTYTLKPDGTGDFGTIQAAIDGTINGDIIELEDGTYAGFGNRDINFSGKAVTIRSASGSR